MQRKKGISLIVLVITIIVMIILAAAIIISLTNNGIIGRANQAVDSSNLSEVQYLASVLWGEARLKGYTTKEQYEDYITEGLKGVDTRDYRIKITTSGVTVSKLIALPDKLMVGDIVEYTPASSYTATNPYVVSNEDTANLKLAGCEGSFYSDDLAASTVEWKVLSIDEAAGTIEIIPSTTSTAKLKLTGVHGYNNGITALNNICATVYGNITNANYTAIARSLKVEDINGIAGYTPQVSTISINASNMTEGVNYFPIEYLKEKGVTEFTEAEISQGYAANSSITVEDTGCNYDVESQSGFNTKFAGWCDKGLPTFCWLASTFITNLMEGGYMAGLFRTNPYGGVSSNFLYSPPDGAPQDFVATDGMAIRPVVTLTLKTALTLDKTEGTGDAAINYWIFE